ncbi:MAG: ribosome-associated translation inhibitor RaiA [Candidatus Brocadiae bacterium]|nr:ribosome-associated translation inhibitor RaiA [Candidatus Brocadiia bacterium]
MKINLLTKLENIPQETKDYAQEKSKKLEKFYKIRKIDIIMQMEGEKYEVEMVVSPERGSQIVASSLGEEWAPAIDSVLEKAERQLRKLKEKVKSHRLKKAKPEAETTKAEKEEKAPKEEEDTYEKVVNKMKNG